MIHYHSPLLLLQKVSLYKINAVLSIHQKTLNNGFNKNMKHNMKTTEI